MPFTAPKTLEDSIYCGNFRHQECRTPLAVLPQAMQWETKTDYAGTQVFNLLRTSASLNDGKVYGQITLKLYPNAIVHAYSDRYNFEMHSWLNPFNWGRNMETLYARHRAGPGTPYLINFYGSHDIDVWSPWLK